MRTIGGKLLLVILPGMLAGVIAVAAAVDGYARSQHVASLQTRLDGFVATASASLAKPLWEFDDFTVDRLARSYGDVPELAGVEVRNVQGRLIAAKRIDAPAGAQTIYRREVELVHDSPNGSYAVGHLTAVFHDGNIRRQIAAEQWRGLQGFGVALVLIALVMLSTVRHIITKPLGRLRDSLRANVRAESRQPLTWNGSDELAEVVYAYNQLVNEIEQRNRDIHALAYHDALTGLPNRRLLEDRLAHALVSRDGGAIAVLFLDIDRFKTINDTLGHQLGDEVLCIIGQRLRDAMPPRDTVARWSGDEFVILVDGITEPNRVSGICDKILDLIGRPVSIDGNLLRIGASIGVSLSPSDGADAATLIRHADLALFEAKGAGRDSYRFFDSEMNLRAMRRLDIEAALRQALDGNELELYYQPKLCLTSGRLHGVEALLRWRRPREGMVPPDVFIPIAEESELIVAIGRWVLREACQQIMRWRATGLGDIQVAVNLSPRHLRDIEEVDAIIDIVDSLGVPHHLIELELTESTVMKEPDRVIAFLWRLRERGFAIAVDDFGTGFSNLAYLRKLPINTLKIDRSFITDIEVDRDDAEIIRTIIVMARTLGLSVVAEGVETAGQLSFLRDCDCHAAQGYHFARPMPAAALPAFLGVDGPPRAAATPHPIHLPLLKPPLRLGEATAS